MGGESSVSGFTLIELIVLIAVLAIVMAIGVPMIGSFLANDQTQAAAGRFQQNMQWARAEAIKTNQTVSVTISGASTTNCAWTITAANASRTPEQSASDFQNHYPGVGCTVTSTDLCFSPLGNLGTGTGCQPGGIYTFDNKSPGSNQWLVIVSAGGEISSCLQGKTAGQCQ
jgi:Tfp pilus assembly protein FimT